MKFKIKLIVDPGDMTVSRAQVRVADKDGAFLDGQVILEGEKIETDVMLMEGQTIEVTELMRPVVYNPETCGAEYLDLTPKDPVAGRMKPPTEPSPKSSPPHQAAHVPPSSPRPKY
jgi:hypothetical protein